MRKLAVVLMLLAVASFIGCSRAPAQAALDSAEKSISELPPEVEKYAGDELAKAKQSLADAKAKFEAGDYEAVIEYGKEVPSQVDALKQAAEAKKEELTSSFTSLQEALPGMVEKVEARIGELSKSARLRRTEGIDSKVVEAAQTGVGEAKDLWGQATTAFQGGELQKALELATSVKTKVEELYSQLKISAA